MTRTLITADLHLSENPRDSYRHQFMEKLPNLVSSRGADRLLLLGDITETKNKHSAWLVNEIVGHLHALAKVCPVTVLRGNHDYLDIDNPFFAFIERIPNITWIGEPEERGQYLYLPHTYDHKRDWKGLDLKRRIIFTHNTFAGAIGESGHQLRGIPVETMRDSKVISGDVHVPQRLETVTYVGAPYTIKFGDEFQPRMLKLESGTITSIPLHGPQKRLVEAIAGEGLFNWPAEINKGDILKVRVHIQQRHVAKWSQIRDDVREWGVKHGYLISAVQPMLSDTGGKERAIRVQARKSDATMVEEYAASRTLDPATLKAGLLLLKKS